VSAAHNNLHQQLTPAALPTNALDNKMSDIKALLHNLHTCSDNLHSTASGSVLANDNLRKLMTGLEHGYQLIDSGHNHGQQQQHLQQQGPHIHVQQSSSNSSNLQQLADPLSISSSTSSSGKTSSGPFGIGSTISFLAGLVKEQQQQQQHGHGHGHISGIPKSNLLVPELPSGTLVLGLNLMAYWAISRQARRGFGA
jgi:hypothetical protein